VTPSPVFPPRTTNWAPPYIPPVELPGFLPPGGVAPPGPPPCDPTKDPECPPPPPPPHDVPEPGVLLILLFGLPAIWIILARRRPAAR